jgi:flagellar hook-associated protein 1 FlgK
MLRSSFASFQTASSALSVAQNYLDVVGQNISNVDTDGYTRQRVDTSSVSTSSTSLQYSTGDVNIGQGVQTTGISQYRDTYLDVRYRNQAAETGYESVQLDALEDVETVFDEIETDGLDVQFSELIEQLETLSSSPSDAVIEASVKTSASMLCQMFNEYSDQLDTIQEDQTSYLEDCAVVDVNQILENISELNQQIRESNLSGNSALELNDSRNTLIDELSSYLEIEVNLTSEDIGGGNTIDVLSINLKGNDMELVNGSDYAQLGVTVEDSGSVKISVIDSIDSNFADGADITEDIDSGEIGGYLEFLNGQGTFNTSDPTDNKGIQYYQSMLDTLASNFADVMNNANITADGTEAPLFESSVTGDDIDASNIKISDAWNETSSSYITNTTKVSVSGDDSGQNDNILKMIALFSNDMDFTTSGGTALFSGTMQEFLSNMSTTVSLQVEDTENSYDICEEALYEIDQSRASISSVDLDEEGVNLIIYQKFYSAAAKLMTTLDEMMETLLNM